MKRGIRFHMWKNACFVQLVLVSSAVYAANCPNGREEVQMNDRYQSLTIVHDGAYYRYDLYCDYTIEKVCEGGGCIRSMLADVTVSSGGLYPQNHQGNDFPADPPFCNAGQLKVLSLRASAVMYGHSPDTVTLNYWAYAH